MQLNEFPNQNGPAEVLTPIGIKHPAKHHTETFEIKKTSKYRHNSLTVSIKRVVDHIPRFIWAPAFSIIGSQKKIKRYFQH